MAEKIIHPDDVHRWMVNLWLRAGSSQREAQLTADHLVGANLAGHDSHGIGMAPRYVKSFKANELQLNQTVEVVLDNGPLITVDARRGMGQSVTHQAMELAIEREIDFERELKGVGVANGRARPIGRECEMRGGGDTTQTDEVSLA